MSEETEWKCIGASYIKKVQGYEVIIETYDGESWSATARSHLCGNTWSLVAEITGLRDQGTAISVAKDLYKLVQTISIKDTYTNE